MKVNCLSVLKNVPPRFAHRQMCLVRLVNCTGKACGSDNLHTEAIKFCHPRIVPLLESLFSVCSKHGLVSRYFCVGRITSVSKKNGLCGEFQDFCAITTANSLGKIFEYCLLNRLELCSSFHELQYGFTSGGGCEKAVHAVWSVIEHVDEYGNSVYLSALDITKAYDRLNHCAVLLKMKQIEVPVNIIIVFWY